MIPSQEEYDYLSENIDHLTLEAIVKWNNHSTILALVSEHKHGYFCFFYYFISKEDIFKEIKKFDDWKAIQENEIPVKTIKRNDYFFLHN